MARADEAVRGIGSRYLATLLHSSAANALCAQAQYAEGASRLGAAEQGLEELARAARLPVAYLLRNSLAGNLALFSHVWLGAVGARPIDYSAAQAIVDAGRAEGQNYVAVGVGTVLAIARYVDLGPEARVEIERVAAEAATVGASLFVSMGNLFAALMRYEDGDEEGARTLLLAIEPSVRTGGTLYSVARLDVFSGVVALADSELAEAERRAHQALSLALVHDFAWETAMSLELLACVAAAASSPVEGVRLAAAAERLRAARSIRTEMGLADRMLAEALATCRDSLGDEAYDAAWAEGYALSTAEAVEYAQRARGERKRPTLGWESLTPTERLVVEQVEGGLTNPQIAEKLLISRDTVKTHLSHVFTKLGVKSRSELAVAAARRAGDHDGLRPVRPAAPR